MHPVLQKTALVFSDVYACSFCPNLSGTKAKKSLEKRKKISHNFIVIFVIRVNSFCPNLFGQKEFTRTHFALVPNKFGQKEFTRITKNKT